MSAFFQPRARFSRMNQKKVVYGGVDYRTGELTYTVSATKCGAEFLAFLIFLVKTYAGQKIRLVCDNGRFHHTKAVQAWLAEHRDEIEVFWLPPARRRRRDRTCTTSARTDRCVAGVPCETVSSARTRTSFIQMYCTKSNLTESAHSVFLGGGIQCLAVFPAN